MARAKGSGVEDLYTLDVHALDELKTKGFVQTDDSPKYSYNKDEHGNYGNFVHIESLKFLNISFYISVHIESLKFLNIFLTK